MRPRWRHGAERPNGTLVTHARISIPSWGCWYAEATLDGEVSLSGSVTLQVADLALKGTIVSGGPELGRSRYRIVAGAGGWGKRLPRASYADDAGVKISTVLNDAARGAGETLQIAGTSRLGASWAREEGPASQALQLIAPSAWYVDELGVTRLGARAAGVLPANVTRVTPLDKARGRVALASDTIALILPGVVVDGMTAIDVPITYEIWIYERSNATAAEIEEAVEAALEAKFADLPIGGDIIAPATTGKVYQSLIASTIRAVYPTDAFRITVTSPAGDTSLTNAQVAVLGLVTGTINIVANPT